MEGTYGRLSNYVHPTPYSIAELFSARETDDGQRVLERQHDVSFHDRLATLVVVLFYHTISFTMDYHGWDFARHQQLTEDIAWLLPGVFVDTLPEAPPPGESTSTS